MIAHSKPYITVADTNAVHAQLASGMISEGDITKKFENDVSNYSKVKYSIATSSGSNALVLAYLTLGIKPRDEIIIPSYVCKNVIQAIYQIGATPVLCDIGDTWCMTAEAVSRCISKRTKAIVLVHIFGINANTDAISKLNVPIIEDRCQAFGLEEAGKLEPLKGRIAVYSFHGTKCLTTGEGGMLSMNDVQLSENANRLKNEQSPFHRLSDLQASLGISQLKQYDKMKGKRKQIVDAYFKFFPEDLTQNTVKVSKKSIFFRFPIKIKNKDIDKSIDWFSAKGISVRRGVDELLHRSLNQNDKKFSNTVETFKRTLSLPIYPSLTVQEVDKIIYYVNKFYKS